MRELFRAKAMLAPGVEQELGRDVYGRAWDLSGPDRGNFTSLSEEVRDLEVTAEKALRFRMGAEKVTLGWGNADGSQPLGERTHLWPWHNYVELRVKQTGERSTWPVRFSHDGQRPGDAVERSLEGQEWQTLNFASALSPYQSLAQVCPDAFAVEIEGEEGSVIEIASVRITRQVHEGCCRREVELPQGEICATAAQSPGDGGGGRRHVPGRTERPHVNGREVAIENSLFRRPRLDGPESSKVYRGSMPGTVP